MVLLISNCNQWHHVTHHVMKLGCHSDVMNVTEYFVHSIKALYAVAKSLSFLLSAIQSSPDQQRRTTWFIHLQLLELIMAQESQVVCIYSKILLGFMSISWITWNLPFSYILFHEKKNSDINRKCTLPNKWFTVNCTSC